MWFNNHRLKKCINLDDFRVLAKKSLPKMIFDFVDGAADDEVSYRHNREAFNHIRLLPRALQRIESVDLSTSVLGQTISLPVVLAPVAIPRLFHPSAEKIAASAANRANTIYTLSSLSTYSIEEVAAHVSGPKWFQIYVWKDRALVKEIIERCRVQGYQALCLTVDATVAGNRERDLRHGMTIPPKITLPSALEMLMHPLWLGRTLTTPPLELANIKQSPSTALQGKETLIDFVKKQFDTTVTWDDVAWMIAQWGGPFIIKGLIDPKDCKRAVEVGANGVVVSNHGGRQLDHCPSPIEVLPDVVDAVAGQADILLDSGVRRGTDIIKALALGAKACLLGRPYIYAMAAGGEAAIDWLFTLLRAELERDITLLGCKSVAELSKTFLR